MEERTERTAWLRDRLGARGARSLARHALDHALDTPLRQFMPAEALADLFTTALRSAAENPALERGFSERVRALFGRVPAGTLRARIPADAVAPLDALLRRPLLPDRVLVRRLLRHEAVEALLRDTLVGAIQSFAGRIRLPGVHLGPPVVGRSLGRLRDAVGEARREGLLSGLSHGLERQAEQRIQDFVDSVLQTVMDEVATHLCAEEHAALYGDWRGWLLQTLLDSDLPALAREAEKVDPDALAGAGTAIARALVRREGLRQELERGFEQILTGLGDRSARTLLAEAGVEEVSWRPAVEALLAARITAFAESAAFDAWMAELDEDGSKAPPPAERSG